MSEERLNKLENAMTDMAEKFGEFLAIESARKERDKHQMVLNDKIEEFISLYREHDKPVVDTSRKWQGWVSHFIGKVALPAILVAILLAAGAQIYEKSATPQDSTKVK